MPTALAMDSNAHSGWSSPTQTRFRQRDQALIKLAEALIQEQGLVSFRFSDLAPRAGCSAGTLYKHFGCKEDLLVAIFSRHVEQLVERQPHLMACDLSFAERWVAMHLVAVLAVNEKFWSLGLNAMGGAPKVLERANEHRVQELRMYLNQFYGAILRVVEGARIQGELVSGDQQVRAVHTMMTCLQRGAAGTLNNPLMQDTLKPLDKAEIYQAFATLISVLDWHKPLNEGSYSRVINEVEHQLNCIAEERAMAAF